MQFIVNKDNIIKTIESNQLLMDEELHVCEVNGEIMIINLN